jgi:cytochrome b561
MPALNDTAHWGWVSRAIHWLMALGILSMLAFGTYIARMQPALDNLWLYGLHKSIGLCLLSLVLLRLLWHRISAPPHALPGPRWQLAAARWSHGLLYGLMLLVPASGWIGSAATGIDVELFGYALPGIAPVSEAWDKAGFAVHFWATRLLIVLAALHAAAALWHHFARRDATLRRMWRG